jgi:hypothetical protein
VSPNRAFGFILYRSNFPPKISTLLVFVIFTDGINVIITCKMFMI